MWKCVSGIVLAVALLGGQESSAPQDAGKTADKKTAAKAPRLTPREALARFNVLVGEWRGIGQPKRGSSRGAWSEKSQWQWDFSKKEQPVLRLVSDKGQLVRQLWLGYDTRRGEYTLKVKFKDLKTPQLFRAIADPRRLVFVQAESTDKTERRRVKLTVLSEKRVTLVVERGVTAFRRVAEVGYTRKGTSIVTRGSGKPECVVTGGAGTIRVTYKGKTWYVCCSGCKQAFEDAPETILAEYRASQKKKAAARVP